MMGKKEPDLPNQIARFLTKQGISLENMEAQIGKSKVLNYLYIYLVYLSSISI